MLFLVIWYVDEFWNNGWMHVLVMKCELLEGGDFGDCYP